MKSRVKMWESKNVKNSRSLNIVRLTPEIGMFPVSIQ